MARRNSWAAPHFIGSLAQLAEQVAVNHRVTGSIPVGSVAWFRDLHPDVPGTERHPRERVSFCYVYIDILERMFYNVDI